MKLRIFLLFLIAVALAGCATTDPVEPAPSDASLLKFTGEPVSEIRFWELMEWHPYNREYVLLEFNQNQWYAVNVLQPCYSDVRTVNRLGLNTFVDQRLRDADRLYLDDRDCRINEIRPLDFAAFKDSREAELAGLAQNRNFN